ncbi:MAG: UvrD-helicase domain-containing protein, partial [Solobacterium sp.]|nr:UvrD-helicase domain-containing protein [Solobacterium sp.]
HCFSSWGQDFRVDYLYIAKFIRELNKEVPVSCFTATAKPAVIKDIRDYFMKELNLDLKMFTASMERKNLHYRMIKADTDEEKYRILRALIIQHDCPAIVYVSRTKKAEKLAMQLAVDGIAAKAYHGQMDPAEKVAVQDGFLKNELRVIVATSAFGMGVDKKDIGLVVHFEISGSLEDYIQEAGRAGRDEHSEAECCVLYNENDLDKHFLLQNQTKVSLSEINAVWKAIKKLCGKRKTISCSPLEIARAAGWNTSVYGIETRAITAIAALEHAGYLERGKNVPQVFADSITARSVIEANEKIDASSVFSDEKEKTMAKRIIRSLITSRALSRTGVGEAESRVDYLAEMLGLSKQDVIRTIENMRSIGLLADYTDMSASVKGNGKEIQAAKVLKLSSDLERLLLSKLGEGVYRCQLKEFNEEALETIPESSLKRIRTILGFLALKGDIRKEDLTSRISLITPLLDPEKLREKQQRRIDICDFILEEFFRQINQQKVNEEGEKVVQFSLQGVYDRYQETHLLDDITRQDVEDALLYLSRIGAIHIEGGFLVLYNAMSLSRKTMNNNVIYKKADYKELQNYYRMKTRQIHIAGEFADLLYEQPDKALLFSKDYFSMDFEDFRNKYFDASRKKEIERNLTASKYEELFGSLSPIQQEIIQDDASQYIAILAGPGSGKTMVLVHKLASLLLKEDVKHEQLLMLTFSRAAATEFKLRLKKLIGNGANFVEIKTFHSYCFDLMGKIGNPEDSADIVRKACDLIESEEIDTEGLYKKVLVIDEAQDMDENEYRLVRLLMEANDEMRVIMVGDDDQNIYAFRGSDARYFRDFRDTFHAKGYEMTENYRSDKAIVDFANSYAVIMENRMKTIPLSSASDRKGIVHVTEYDCPNLAEGLVKQLIKTRQGTAGVLTATNEEAMQVVTLLQENGIRARLVGTDNSFGLINLAEVRWFLKDLEKEPVINKEIWNDKVEKLEKRYQTSGIIRTVLNMLRTFREVNERIFLSDLKEFIRESQFEDFQEDKKSVVQVSTIHKAKGKEYDTVYLLLSEYRLTTAESRRVLYVGMTRARHALYIHSCGCLLPNHKQAMYER